MPRSDEEWLLAEIGHLIRRAIQRGMSGSEIFGVVSIMQSSLDEMIRNPDDDFDSDSDFKIDGGLK